MVAGGCRSRSIAGHHTEVFMVCGNQGKPSSDDTPLLSHALEYLCVIQEELLEQFRAVVEEEQGHEPVKRTLEQVRGELVYGLLLGDASLAEIDRLGYKLEDAWHLGIVATGAGAVHALKGCGVRLGRELLLVPHGRQVWAWLGGSCQVEPTDVQQVISKDGHAEVSLACGEPSEGIDGWRLTHHQARAARRVAVYNRQRLTWYANGPLLAAALRDETLSKSLRQKYIAPLASLQNEGEEMRRTLRAYIDADCSSTSAESILQVRRHTVARRVRAAEQRIGRTIRDCLPELDVALRLEEIDKHHHRQPFLHVED
jgi:hypothetical protein